MYSRPTGERSIVIAVVLLDALKNRLAIGPDVLVAGPRIDGITQSIDAVHLHCLAKGEVGHALVGAKFYEQFGTERPYSEIDAEGEAEICESLQTFLSGRTAIVVSISDAARFFPSPSKDGAAREHRSNRQPAGCFPTQQSVHG